MSKQSMDERRSIKLLISKVKSLISTMETIMNNSEEIGFNYSSCNTFMSMYQELVIESQRFITSSSTYHTYDTGKAKNVFDMTGIEQKILFESVFCSAKMLLNVLENQIDYNDDERLNLYNLISTRFRSVFRVAPSNEKEVQDKLEDFFIANSFDKGIDYDRETGKFNFSGREYIPDFIVPKLKLCIEVKLIKDKNRKSKVIEEINSDITAYQKNYDHILFLVYDLGTIRDEIEFKRDIEANERNSVIILKQ